MHGKGHSYSNYEWDGVLEFLMKQSNKNPLARLPPAQPHNDPEWKAEKDFFIDKLKDLTKELEDQRKLNQELVKRVNLLEQTIKLDKKERVVIIPAVGHGTGNTKFLHRHAKSDMLEFQPSTRETTKVASNRQHNKKKSQDDYETKKLKWGVRRETTRETKSWGTGFGSGNIGTIITSEEQTTSPSLGDGHKKSVSQGNSRSSMNIPLLPLWSGQSPLNLPPSYVPVLAPGNGNTTSHPESDELFSITEDNTPRNEDDKEEHEHEDDTFIILDSCEDIKTIMTEIAVAKGKGIKDTDKWGATTNFTSITRDGKEKKEESKIGAIKTRSDLMAMGNKYLVQKFNLKSHLDAVRGLYWPFLDYPYLITGGEDSLLKLWDCGGQNEHTLIKNIIDPLYTFRGHRGAIMSISGPKYECGEVLRGGEIFYSAGSESRINIWRLPPSSCLTPYPSTGEMPIPLVTEWKGHKDVIWELTMHPTNPFLLSVSADGTVKIWKHLTEEPQGFNSNSNNHLLGSLMHREEGIGIQIPTSAAWVPATNKILVSYVKPLLLTYDQLTGKSEVIIRYTTKKTHINTEQQANKVMMHGNLGITGHENKYIRFFDINAGKNIHSMVAHTEAVSDISSTKDENHILSVGHDGSLRCWDLRNYSCLYDILVFFYIYNIYYILGPQKEI